MFRELLESKTTFEVGDTIKYKKGKGGMNPKPFYKIAAIENKRYIFSDLRSYVPIAFQDDFEKVK